MNRPRHHFFAFPAWPLPLFLSSFRLSGHAMHRASQPPPLIPASIFQNSSTFSVASHPDCKVFPQNFPHIATDSSQFSSIFLME